MKPNVVITHCTPHEHLFKPESECLPGKGHRSGGVASLVAHEYYKPKPLGFDPNDLPDWCKPGNVLGGNRKIPSSKGP